jgi:hypothetical protein
MNEGQRGAPAKKPSSGKIILLGALATALAIFNLSSGGEAPSQAVLILEYIFLAGGLIALIGGVIMMAAQR